MWIRSSTVTYVHLRAAAHNMPMWMLGALNSYRCDAKKAEGSPPSSAPGWLLPKLLLCQGTLVLQQVSSLGLQHVDRIFSLFVCRIRECLADTTLELIFCCTTFYMQLMHARIGVSEMRGSYGHFTVTSGHYSHPQIGEYGHAIRLNTVTLVTSGWCDSDHKGHPFKVNVLTLCGYIGQPKNTTTVTMPQQRGDRKTSITLLALWSGFLGNRVSARVSW